jgi:hypothetical protein
MSAERDGRPVFRKNRPRVQTVSPLRTLRILLDTQTAASHSQSVVSLTRCSELRRGRMKIRNLIQQNRLLEHHRGTQ